MKLNLKEKNSYLRTLNVVIPWEELKDEYYKEFKKIIILLTLQVFKTKVFTE